MPERRSQVDQDRIEQIAINQFGTFALFKQSFCDLVAGLHVSHRGLIDLPDRNLAIGGRFAETTFEAWRSDKFGFHDV